MKSFIILLAILGLGNLRVDAQNESSDTLKFKFSGHIVAKGKTQKELYLSARDWFIQKFDLPRDILLVQDKEEGEIIGRCEINYNGNDLQSSAISFGIVYFRCSIKVQNGFIEYSLTDFTHIDAFGVPNGGDLNNRLPYAGTGNLFLGTWRKIKIKTYNDARDIEKSLIDYVTK